MPSYAQHCYLATSFSLHVIHKDYIEKGL
jgi:hypothetical protein